MISTTRTLIVHKGYKTIDCSMPIRDNVILDIYNKSSKVITGNTRK